MLIDDILTNSNSVLAAWLPGTSGGQGIVDAIVGDYIIKPSTASSRNTLSMDWPSDMVIYLLFRPLLRIFPSTVVMEWCLRLIILVILQDMAYRLTITTSLNNDSTLKTPYTSNNPLNTV